MIDDTWEKLKFMGDELRNLDRRGIFKKIKSLKKDDLKYFVKDYIASCVGELALSTPFFAFLETYVGRVLPFMDELGTSSSEEARLKIIGINVFFGLAYVISKTREGSRWFFKYSNGDLAKDKKKITRHDGKLNAILSFFPQMFIYLTDKTLETKQVITNSFLSTGGSYFSGIFNGYGNDLSKSLLGVRDSKRIPNSISKASKFTRYALFGGLVFGSMSLTKGIYESYNYLFPVDEKVNVEKIGGLEKNVFEWNGLLEK